MGLDESYEIRPREVKEIQVSYVHFLQDIPDVKTEIYNQLGANILAAVNQKIKRALGYE